MAIIKNILENNDCRRMSTTMSQPPQGIMLHSVACAQPDAKVFLRLWNTPGVEIGVHGIVDGLTGDTYQCLPWDWLGWHAGGPGNLTHIGIEMCEPACIRYTGQSDQFEVRPDALNDAREVALRTYKGAVDAFAQICKLYDLDPRKDGVILSHSEAGRRGLSHSGHTDPEHLWKGLKMSLTMDTFREDVALKMYGMPVYRVQVGAFYNRDYAEAYRQKVIAAGFPDAFIVKEDPDL